MKQQDRLFTQVKSGGDLAWSPISEHPGLYHKEIVSAAEADALGVSVSSVLWERIDVGGAVLPHYHDVAEVIHITVGRVKLLCNGMWLSFGPGDTFHVPAGVVHSVRNDDAAPTEQISIFLPEGHYPPNAFFRTLKVDGGGLP